MRRPLALAVAAAALSAVAAPLAAHASTGPDPVCKFVWPHGYPVYVDGDGNVTVDPNARPQWVC